MKPIGKKFLLTHFATSFLCKKLRLAQIPILIIGGFICLSTYTKASGTEEEISNDCLEVTPLGFLGLAEKYILAKHPETSAYLSLKAKWEGGRITPKGLLGHETYQYHKDKWSAKIEWNVVPKPIYKIILSYNSQILWRGNIDKYCKIEELEYVKIGKDAPLEENLS